jgi:hypothetical protein
MRLRQNPEWRQGPFASRVGMDGLNQRFNRRRVIVVTLPGLGSKARA